MTKSKFVLTKDLIRVEPEPTAYLLEKLPQKEIKQNVTDQKDRISLNIDHSLKRELHLYCVNNRKKMTDIIEISIREYLDRNIS